MVRISYHASHEQFPPSRLLKLVVSAEAAGFHEAKCSDHFHPWSERQGQSGFTWSWLGAALEASSLRIGNITAPGYRYHPAVLAQAAATLGEMYPGRFWLALGSGEAINEAITGLPWPEKAERNARLGECVSIFRALFAGETVTHRGRVTVIEAKLYTRPEVPVPLFGAALSEATARFVGEWGDGLLTGGWRADEVRPLIDAFRTSAGADRPVHVQMAVCLSRSMAEAEAQALAQWSAAALGGEVSWDLRRPADFDRASQNARAEDLRDAVLITTSMTEILDAVAELAETGADVVHLHQVAEDQETFIDAFARHAGTL